MGLYDRLTFEDGLDIAFPDIDADPFEITWQTKTLARHHPALEHYKVTREGRLYKEEVEHESVPEEERPEYNEEIGGFEDPTEKMRGSIRKHHHGWTGTKYHGIFEFHTSLNGEYISLEAKFTDGDLVEVRRSSDTE